MATKTKINKFSILDILNAKPITLFVLMLLMSCQKEKNETPKAEEKLIKMFHLGDTLTNNKNTSFEETKVIIDSISQLGFKLTSEHTYIPTNSESYFIRIEFDYKDKIRILDSLADGGLVFSGPILSTFAYGDTIDINLTNKEKFDWFPKNETQMANSGWIKYHIYSPFLGVKVENLKLGENYIVFKFGDIGNERIGWLNIVYLDTLCYIKEGFYNAKADESLIVGKK